MLFRFSDRRSFDDSHLGLIYVKEPFLGRADLARGLGWMLMVIYRHENGELPREYLDFGATDDPNPSLRLLGSDGKLFRRTSVLFAHPSIPCSTWIICDMRNFWTLIVARERVGVKLNHEWTEFEKSSWLDFVIQVKLFILSKSRSLR